MEARQVIAQAVGFVLAVLAVRWAVVEARRDWKTRRLPLVRGPFIGRTMRVTLGAIMVPLPVLYAAVAFTLIPRGSPLAFAAMLAWIAGAFSGALLGLVAMQVRRGAVGWLTILGDDTLQLAADGTTDTFTLVPGAVRVFPADLGASYVQLEIAVGDRVFCLWCMIGLREMKYVSSTRPTPPVGLMIGSSTSRLFRWLAPFVATDSTAPPISNPLPIF